MAEYYTRAAGAYTARSSQQPPLTDREKELCRLTGVTEQAFLAVKSARTATTQSEPVRAPSVQSDGLTERERSICAQIGVTPEAFKAHKALMAAQRAAGER